MKLDTLALSNFKSYREALLELAQVAQAAVVGHNGAGKSTILDAVLYALFGKGAFDGAAADDWITKGEQDMRVELTFLLDGVSYRVIRARTNRSRGKTVLELQRQTGTEWTPLSRDDIRQTQTAIEKLLRLDFDGFVASAFLLQGRSAEFTSKPPAERKRVLYQILGLDQYDTLAAAARERARDARAQVATLRSQIADADQQLLVRPAAEDERQRLDARRTDLAGQIVAQEEAIAQAQAAIAELDTRLAQRPQLQQQLQDLDRERSSAEGQAAKAKARCTEAQARIAGAEQRITRARQITDRRAEIEAKAGEKARLDARLTELARLHERDAGLCQAIKAAEERREGARGRIDRAWEVARHEDSIRAKASYRDDLDAKRQDMDRLAGEDRRLRQALSQAQAAHARWTADRRVRESRLQADLEAARRKADLLATDFGCDSPSKGHGCQFLADAYQAQQQMADLCAALAALRQETPPPEVAQVPALEAQLAALGYDPGAHQDLQGRISVLDPWARRLPELETALAAIAAAKGEIALAEADATRSRQEQRALGYVEAEHSRLQDSLPELERWARLVPELAAADATIEAAAAEKEVAESQAQEAQADEKAAYAAAADVAKRRADVEQKRRDLLPLQVERQNRSDGLQSLQGGLSALRLDMERLGQDLGRVQERLRHLDSVAASAVRLAQEQEGVIRRQTVWDVLTEAYGPGGIPALIIENAVPELEATANALLGRLSGGTMSVRLDTQRQAKSGNVSETLDITISDALGERPYETYSGGERFRVDFALRVALAKLLARRAGATVRCLWVDEGVAPLDADGRQRFVECIRAIEPDFDQVFCISHVQELNEQFSCLIEVWKDGEGSHVRVAS